MDLKPLLPYLPQAEVLPLLDHWLKDEAFDLAIHKPRATKLGDFRPPKRSTCQNHFKQQLREVPILNDASA